jgi:hypothetical protein
LRHATKVQWTPQFFFTKLDAKGASYPTKLRADRGEREANDMSTKMNVFFIRSFAAFSLIATVWSTAVYAQQAPSGAHEEREDRRQEDVVQNMHFADDVLKSKFLVVYVPYQERLFKIDHAFRDLINSYTGAQAGGQILSGDQARKLLERGEVLQREYVENLNGYINKLKQAIPGGVALQAWIIENKLHAATASQYLSEVPFVTQ